MSAAEFIKKFGWGAAKDLASRSKTSIGYLSVDHHELDQSELQRYVDAYEFVQSYGGTDESKTFLKSEYRKISTPTTYNNLKQAIKLVEEI